ncbi:hypothetical protein LY78DRAFT_80440 [Colletotrichum sublineola]|nr:hypothetical protein LY78DRAFT_80440 [Colletotrichum sublineola]
MCVCLSHTHSLSFASSSTIPDLLLFHCLFELLLFIIIITIIIVTQSILPQTFCAIHRSPGPLSDQPVSLGQISACASQSPTTPSPFALINRFSTHSEVAFRISPPLPAIINPPPACCYWRSLRHLRDLRDGTRMPFSSVLFHPPCSTLSGHILAFCVGGVVVLLASASPL